MKDIGHFIAGQTVPGKSGRAGEVFNPNTGEVQAKVALATPAVGRKAYFAADRCLVQFLGCERLSRADRLSAPERRSP